MTIKQTLENHVVVVSLSISVAAFGAGWGACELARVAYKTDKIADLDKKISEQSQQIKDGNVAIEPYQKQIAGLLLNTQRLETELNNSQGNLAQWRQALQSWEAANKTLENDLKLYTSNCSVISLVRALEKSKDSIEQTLTEAYSWPSEKPKIDDYKRRVSEYHSRLLSLNEKLACIPR